MFQLLVSLVLSVMAAVVGSSAAWRGVEPIRLRPGKQDRDLDEEPHILVGSWQGVSASGVVTLDFSDDGNVRVRIVDANGAPPQRLFAGSAIGHWENTGPRSAAYVVVQDLIGMTGTFLGTATITSFVTVSRDGERLIHALSLGSVTVRRADGTILSVVNGVDVLLPSAAQRCPAHPSDSDELAMPALA